MAKASLRLAALFGAILSPLFVLFWALDGPLYAAKITATLAGVVLLALPFVFVLFTVMFFVPVAVHEAGHYLAGRREGFGFVLAIVGPFGWRREGDRVARFHVRPAILGGFVGMVPPDVPDAERRYARFIAGGPVASLALVAVVFLLWRISGLPVSTQIPNGSLALGFLALGFQIAAFGSLLVLPGTLLPYRIKAFGGTPTDMMRLLTLRRGGRESRALFAHLTLQRMLLGGVPAGELPVKLIADAEREGAEDLQQLGALQIRWAHELENRPEAAGLTAERLDLLTAKLRKGLHKDWIEGIELVQAEQAAYGRRDADAAEARLPTSIPEGQAMRLAHAVVKAAIAALRRTPDLGTLLDAADEALVATVARSSIDMGFERRWIAAMRRGWPNEEAGSTEGEAVRESPVNPSRDATPPREG